MAVVLPAALHAEAYFSPLCELLPVLMQASQVFPHEPMVEQHRQSRR